MSLFYINFSDDKFIQQQKYLSSKYTEYGFITKMYGVSDIFDFVSNNESIFKYKRGFGYWSWKPYIILNTFHHMNDGDILLYTDCGDDVICNPSEFLSDYLSSIDILLIENKFNNRSYTKRDCFFLMGCDSDKYHESNQLEAGIISLKKSRFTTMFINEWLEYCKSYDIISDEVKYKNNYSDFIDHRHDQSILTNLQIKHDIKTLDIDNMKPYFGYGLLKNKL
jgi:hypothetical protein